LLSVPYYSLLVLLCSYYYNSIFSKCVNQNDRKKCVAFLQHHRQKEGA
jgi:hypothetical protein